MKAPSWRVLTVSLSLGSLAPAALLLGADRQTATVEHSKPLPRNGPGLGTTRYVMTPLEKLATKAWTKQELDSGSPNVHSLHGPIGRRIAWFGIVREVVEDKPKDETRLLVEMTYFDGLTDLHQQIVSLFGAGDFRVLVPGTGHRIEKLSLVRVYGKVVDERGGVPNVAAQFVRVWRWKLFAFMNYGEDRSNPQWVKLRKIGSGPEIYSSEPDELYYEERLGSR
jgi:hypothetical protein